ncbi:MAG: DUF4124 domain-containing protein [Desulfobacteraceae bacterium]|nr:DUF4124 domain-containing protein [Desulfobacteraceae bacterium]MCF8094156.1 DUF4124 domain-containing protein [Desulfobacteraceae bacterium]
MKGVAVMRLTLLYVIVFALIFVGHGYAELYQYKDSEGVIHYTDDFGSIPESYRNNVKIQSEIKSAPPEKKEDKESGRNQQEDSKEQSAEKSQVKEKDNKELLEKRQNLINQRKALQEEYKQLKEERERLLNNPPDDSAPAAQKREYSQKVQEVNNRIETYQKKAEAFEKKVEAFNSKVDEQSKSK